MRFMGGRVTITPVCVANHGIENRVDEALSILKQKMVKSLKAYPDSDIEVEYHINSEN